MYNNPHPKMHNKIRTLLLVTLIISNFTYSQKSNSLQFFGSPFIQKIGSLNYQYTEVSNEYIEVDYLKVPSKEFGLEYHHNFQRNWGYSIGFSWANSGIKSITTLHHSESYNYVLDVQYKTLNYSSIGLRLGGSYKLTDRIKIHAYLNCQLPYEEIKNTWWLTDYTIQSGQLFQYKTKIIVGGTVGSIPDIIPELRGDFELTKNFNFYMGMRLKFWDLFDDYTMKVEVTGFAGNENFGKDEILHSSKAKGTDVSYYFGLMYNLPLKKKVKIE
jgi:hypothetical protein